MDEKNITTPKAMVMVKSITRMILRVSLIEKDWNFRFIEPNITKKTKRPDNPGHFVVFPSQVRELSVPGLEEYRPRSALLLGTCDARRHRMPKTVPGL